MKTIIAKFMLLAAVLTTLSCNDDTFDVDYQSPIVISFKGVAANNIVTLDKGVTTYTATIDVVSTRSLSYIDIYNANTQTGEQGEVIPDAGVIFSEETNSYSLEYVFTDVEENQCIKVVVSDNDGKTVEKNLLTKITPAVNHSESKLIETADAFYGTYYASWLYGRVYFRSNGAPYAAEIDFSLGDLDPTGSEGIVSSLVSPAKRSDYGGIPNLSGLQETKFELTTMTADDYAAVSYVDATPISSLADPTLDAISIQVGKVYSFKTTKGRKGLIHIASITPKTATIEVTPGEWVQNKPYSLVKLSTKTIAD